jgi:hypothetical protein
MSGRDQAETTSGKPPARREAGPKEAIAIGLLVAAIGLYFMAVGAGLLPIPGGKKNLHAPLWVVLFCGVPFFLGGVTVLLHGLARTGASGELPVGAPFWMHAAQYLIGIAIFASFAVIGSWVAIGGDDRGFSGPGGASVARVMFGIGAVIVWLATVGYAVQGARKLAARLKA